jgi:hypothetical protein
MSNNRHFNWSDHSHAGDWANWLPELDETHPVYAPRMYEGRDPVIIGKADGERAPRESVLVDKKDMSQVKGPYQQ